MVQASTMFALGVIGCSSFFSVSASPVVAMERDAALDGKTIVPTMWRGILEAGKPMVYLNGSSYDDIEAQAKALNPAYTIFAQRNSTAEQDTDLSARDLRPRAVTSIHCGWPPNYSAAPDYWQAYWGCNYLTDLEGECGAPAGPARCARVTCSAGSAIYFCNDNTRAIWEPCRWIGQTASKIFEQCATFTNGAGKCHGQAFIDRNWNAIIAKGDC